jgi:hypothetical protein
MAREKKFSDLVEEMTPKDMVTVKITKEDIEAYRKGEIRYSWQDEE